MSGLGDSIKHKGIHRALAILMTHLRATLRTAEGCCELRSCDMNSPSDEDMRDLEIGEGIGVAVLVNGSRGVSWIIGRQIAEGWSTKA